MISRMGVCASLGLACLAPMSGPINPPTASQPAALPGSLSSQPVAYDKLPVAFEVNEGQTDRRVRFLARLPGYSVFLSDAGATFVFPPRARDLPGDRTLLQRWIGSGRGPTPATPSVPAGREIRREGEQSLQLRFVGASGHPRVVGLDRLPGKVHDLMGNDPHRWHTNISTYGRVEYRDVYPGVDLVFHGAQNRIEYDWLIRPGASPRDISLAVGPAGNLRALSLHLGREGGLLIEAGNGHLTEARPHIYQYMHGLRTAVSGGYRLLGRDRVGFRVGKYDWRRALVIDPVLSYSTYLGGSDYDFASDVAVDAGGNTYVVGSTGSADFPTVHAVQGRNLGGMEGSDAFVSKLNQAGTALIYSTYLGGHGDEVASGVAVDGRGEAHITGFSASSDFPMVHPLPVSRHGRCVPLRQDAGDAFVAELSPAGSALTYSTCLGGSGVDGGTRVALDAAGDTYVTGTTGSRDFPTARGLQAGKHGGTDAFVAELDPGGRRLIYSSYLGGRGEELGNGIAVDAQGNVYLAGSTTSPDFPAVHALQSTNRGGTDGMDAFVAKLAAGGESLLYSTYLGGSGDDVAAGVACDDAGDAYVTGSTTSSDFPTENALQSAHRGQTDAFVARLSAMGTSLVYSTYLGGSLNDAGTDVAVDGLGSAYLTGYSASADFPTAQALQPVYGGGYYYGDAFVAKLSSDGHDLGYSTYLGGKGDDVGMGLGVDRAGNAYVAGGTSSVDFPIAGLRGAGRPERGNAFVARIGIGSSPAVGQPSITIDRVAILRSSSQGLELTRVLRLKEKGLFIVLYHALNADSSLPTGTIRFTQGGKVIRQGSMTRGVETDGTPYFFVYETFQRKRLAGRVVARVTLSLRSADDVQSVRFALQSNASTLEVGE